MKKQPKNLSRWQQSMQKNKSKHWFDPVIRLEMYSGWSLGRANLPLQALQFYLLLSLKVGDFWSVILVVGGTLGAIILGWWGVERQRLMARQVSLNNLQNPEMQELLKRSNESKKKKKYK